MRNSASRAGESEARSRRKVHLGLLQKDLWRDHASPQTFRSCKPKRLRREDHDFALAGMCMLVLLPLLAFAATRYPPAPVTGYLVHPLCRTFVRPWYFPLPSLLRISHKIVSLTRRGSATFHSWAILSFCGVVRAYSEPQRRSS